MSNETDSLVEGLMVVALRSRAVSERRQQRHPKHARKRAEIHVTSWCLKVDRTRLDAGEPLYEVTCQCGTRAELTRAEMVLRRELRAGCGRAECPHTPPLMASLETPEAVLTGVFFALVRDDPSQVDACWGGSAGGQRGAPLLVGLERFIACWRDRGCGEWDVFPTVTSNALALGPETVRFGSNARQVPPVVRATRIALGRTSIDSSSFLRLFRVDKADFLALLYQGLPDEQIVLQLIEAHL